MELRELGYDDGGWIGLAQDRDRWRAYVRAAMNLRVSYLKLRQLLQRGEQKQVGKSGCDVGKRTVPVRKYDSILKAVSSLENANIFLERTILTNSVLFTICGLDSVWRRLNFISRRGGSEVHSKTQEVVPFSAALATCTQTGHYTLGHTPKTLAPAVPLLENSIQSGTDPDLQSGHSEEEKKCGLLNASRFHSIKVQDSSTKPLTRDVSAKEMQRKERKGSKKGRKKWMGVEGTCLKPFK
ncbi:hypothetical protein ANN_24274 [Periplaneta americana]|uniref:Uncharacterized protein n=1 Tax=Periplaneta americana TaxID=6978 RepID=A0ABQ8S303_PERAM|nr:hypothetical protein ANN_24274 [Periplaneta americana]